MQPDDVLKYLIKRLHLSVDEIATTLAVYPIVLQAFQRLRPAPPIVQNDDREEINANDRIVVCQQNLQLFIDVLGRYDGEEYKKTFPVWEHVRNENCLSLLSLAKSLTKTRQICNISKVVSGSVGAAGGTAIVVSLSVTVPVLLPVVGSLAAAAGGIAAFATSIAEFAELKKHLEKAKKICKIDKSNFKLLETWLIQSEELKQAMAALIDFDVVEKMFLHLNDLRRERARLSVECTNFVRVVKLCAFFACKTKTNLLFNLGLEAAAITLTTLMSMILFHRRTPSLLQTSKLGLGMANGIEAGIEIAKLIAATGGKGAAAAKLIPNALAKKIAFGAVAGVGIAIDVTMVVLSSIELVKGKTCDEGKMIIALARMMEDERKVLRDVYEELTSENPL